MKGTVKWFSEQKGYGFIVGEDGTEHYFNVRGIVGPSLPNNGSVVSFDSKQGNKGPRAENVQINEQAAKNVDERIKCPHCHKRIVPRIIIYRGSLSHSVCPFCGGKVKNFRKYGLDIAIVVVIIIFIAIAILGG